MGEFWLYFFGFSLIIVSVFVITGSFKLAFGVAFGLAALAFLTKFDESRKAQQ